MDLKEIINKNAILLLSPPLTGKKEFIFLLIKQISNQKGIIFITTDETPEEIKKELLKNKIFFGNNLKFVDCYSAQTLNIYENTDSIVRVGGPLAFNEISIAISNFQRNFLKENKQQVIIFNSLSTLLMYTNPLAVARFLQVIIGKIKNLNGACVFTLEEGMHEKKDIITIEHLMDLIIKLKKENEKILINFSDNEKWLPLF